MYRQDPANRELFLELEELERRGVSIRMDRLPASPYQVADACVVREGSAYMRDYILEEGMLKELCFDRIDGGTYAAC